MKDSATLLTINTVEENRTKYSNLDQRRADKARKFQDIVVLPTRALVNLIDANGIPNCPVTRADLKIADDILGPSLAGLKGKTTIQSELHCYNTGRPLRYHRDDIFRYLNKSTQF